MHWLRRLRGILGIGAVWGLAGTALGAVGGLLASVFFGTPWVSSLIEFGLGAGGIGVLLGSGFALALTLIERRSTLEDLSPGRAALWGALAGAFMPVGSLLLFLGSGGTVPFSVAVTAVPLAAAVYGALSAGLAAGTVSLAKRAPAELISGSLPENRELKRPEL